MVHNPGRNKAVKKRKFVPKNLGRKQSQIAASEGVGSTRPVGSWETTAHGTRSVMVEGPVFAQYYDIIQPRNLTKAHYSAGQVSFNVLKGPLYVNTVSVTKTGKARKGTLEQHEVLSGKCFVVNPGTGYSLASSTFPAEYITTESTNFAETLKEITASQEIITEETVSTIAKLEASKKTLVAGVPPRRDPGQSKAKLAAEKLAAANSTRPVKKSKEQPTSVDTFAAGVNPVPVVPTED